MKQPAPVIVANERVKAVAALLFNSGGALAAATIVRFYWDPAIDVSFLLWSTASAALIYGAWLTLSLLEEEV